MVAANHALPNLDALNHNELKALIFSQRAQLLSKDEQLLSRDHEIEHLKLLIAKLRRMQFGRKSEKVERQIEQLKVKPEAFEANRAEAAQPPAIESSSSQPSSSSKKRRVLPDHLPRETQTHEPE